VQRLTQTEEFGEQESKDAFSLTLGNKKLEGKEGARSVSVAL
jgi:hypothetical protein